MHENFPTNTCMMIYWPYIKKLLLNLIITRTFIGCSCTVNNITLHNNNLNACVYVYFSIYCMHLCHSRNILHLQFLLFFHINNNMHAIDDIYLVSYLIGRYVYSYIYFLLIWLEILDCDIC